MVRFVGLVVASLVLSTSAAADPWDGKTPRPVSSDLRGPEPEHGDPQAKIVVPAVPPFEVPVATAGTLGVRELLVTGRPLLNTDVKVSGYVIWIYDCLAAVRRPGDTRAKTQKTIEYDPTMCERPKFYANPASSKALFQRGQAYVRLKKRKEAKRDLEAFLAVAPDSLTLAKQQANKLLMDLASR